MVMLSDIRRSRRGVQINRDRIVAPDVELDPIFFNLYKGHLTKRHTAAFTRLRLGRITLGFYRKNQGGSWEHIVDPPVDPTFVKDLAKYIRGGHRFPVCVYEVPNGSTKTADYVCPDDQNALAAYQMLGIQLVPVWILGRRRLSLNESAIIVRAHIIPDGIFEAIVGLQAARFEHVESILGIELPVHIDYGLSQLMEVIQRAQGLLRNFHCPAPEVIHYHHTLHSVLVRAMDTIDGIRMLVKGKLHYQALPLVRSLYELALNFYIDWLAPELMGPMLHFAAAVDKREWESVRHSRYDKMKKKGLREDIASQLLKADLRAYDFTKKVSEKARISPLSSKHQGLYAYLSGPAHQDFSMTVSFADTLEQPGGKETELEEWQVLLQFVDIITAQIVARIEAEIGNSTSGMEADTHSSNG